MGNRTNEYIKRKVIELRDKVFGGKCLFCGSITDLQFAHIRPTFLTSKGRGRKERYYDIRKNPDCYRLMCKYCHKKFDSGELKIE